MSLFFDSHEECRFEDGETSNPIDDRPFVSVCLRMLSGDLECVTNRLENDLIQHNRWTQEGLAQEKRAGRILYSRRWDAFFHPAGGI